MSDGAPGVDVAVVTPERTAEFRRAHDRDALSERWDFRAVWHEQRHEIAAIAEAGDVVGVLAVRIAASLAHVESVFVLPARRHAGVGRTMVARAETLANYYNCHKVTLEAPAGSAALAFFLACDYRVEATLAQHTWKRDVVVLRKFLL